MALNTFLDFSTTAASNVDVAGIGIQGANAVSNFDNAFRQLMAILRRDLDNGMVLTSKSANYTAVANDNNAVIRFSAAATLSLTAAATLGADWHCWVMADGGAVIIDPNSTETINGATTITIPDGSSTLVICDGTNFRALEDYSLIAAKLDAVQNWVDVASATTTDIGAVASINVRVTGTTTITGLGTVAAGTFRRVRFADALTLTHNGTSLILPGAANITTAAGDIFEFVSEGSGNWRCIGYSLANGAVLKFLAADGTAAAPSHTFTNDPDTGMYSAGANTLGFSTAGTVVMTLTSSAILAPAGTSINSGAPSGSGASQGIGFSDALLTSSKTSTSTLTHFRFCNTNGTVGTIQTSGGSTVYNTTSDGRLKVNRKRLADEIDVGAIIDAIEPVAYDWLSGVTGEPTGERGHGFIAQELHQIIPVAASPGTGDPGDDDFMPWGVDKSSLVTYLWAELQSVRRRLAALEEK